MKATVRIKQKVEFKTLLVKAGVRYYEDATVNGVVDELGDLIPCKDGELWCPKIDIDSGVITNWKQGVTADIHYKVCDAGNYYLMDEQGVDRLSIEDNYVPSCLCPNESGYGDYIIMKVDENGKIEGWDFNESDLDEFENDED